MENTAGQNGHRKTFVVQVINCQNATWQGTVTLTDKGQRQSFRSALELIKLLDSALDTEALVQP